MQEVSCVHSALEYFGNAFWTVINKDLGLQSYVTHRLVLQDDRAKCSCSVYWRSLDRMRNKKVRRMTNKSVPVFRLKKFDPHVRY